VLTEMFGSGESGETCVAETREGMSCIYFTQQLSL
jgi:hypothetical protein